MDAIFNDGKTAARHQVRIMASADYLHIDTSDGRVQVLWPADRISLVDMVDGGAMARFTCASQPDARLQVDGKANVTELQHALPGMFRREAMKPKAVAKLSAILAAAAASIVIFYFSAPYLAGALATLVPMSLEERLGAQSIEDMAEVLAFASDGDAFCEDSAGQAAIDAITARLAAQADTPYRFTVRVINSGMVNAFATTGGHIVLLRGLIMEAEAPEEVIGVLAHEMAHVIARHPTEGLIKRTGLSTIGMLFGDSSMIADIGLTMAALSYSRSDEAEADAIGLELLAKADLRTDGLAVFFERLTAMEDEVTEDNKTLSTLMAMLSTHPPTAARERAARAAGGGKEPGWDEAQWQAIRTMCPEQPELEAAPEAETEEKSE